MPRRIPAGEVQLMVNAVEKYGGYRKAAEALGVTLNFVKARMRSYQRSLAEVNEAEEPNVMVRGRVLSPHLSEWKLPPPGQVRRYIFTCTQNNTHLHCSWGSLKALAKHYNARLCVSRFTYQVATHKKGSVKPGMEAGPETEGLWYAPEIAEHILDEDVVVAPGLTWCGRMTNILPTAIKPLSGLESYTGRRSGIFPHPRFAMQSIASGKYEGTKINYTTGTVTQRNYIARKAGMKAEFHHGYGGLLVEVDDAGNWFCRQLVATNEGVIRDLDLRVKNGKVSSGHRVEAISWGDVHVGTVNLDDQNMLWGEGGMMNVLRPKNQLLHDVLDFHARGHHDRGNCHKMFARHVQGTGDVVDELRKVFAFLHKTSYRSWCRSVVVDSNHHNFMTEWLRTADYRQDHRNALFFLGAQLAVYRAIERGEYAVRGRIATFSLLRWAMNEFCKQRSDDDRQLMIRFLQPDESLILCANAGGGVECGMHGHMGPNGARGTPMNLARMGRKSIIGHYHSAGIHDGVYVGGITGNLDQGYNVGPSSWSHSHVILYETGKRAIVTTWANKWRA